MKVFALIMFIICIVDLFICFACCAIDEEREEEEQRNEENTNAI